MSSCSKILCCGECIDEGCIWGKAWKDMASRCVTHAQDIGRFIISEVKKGMRCGSIPNLDVGDCGTSSYNSTNNTTAWIAWITFLSMLGVGGLWAWRKYKKLAARRAMFRYRAMYNIAEEEEELRAILQPYPEPEGLAQVLPAPAAHSLPAPSSPLYYGTPSGFIPRSLPIPMLTHRGEDPENLMFGTPPLEVRAGSPSAIEFQSHFSSEEEL